MTEGSWVYFETFVIKLMVSLSMWMHGTLPIAKQLVALLLSSCSHTATTGGCKLCEDYKHNVVQVLRCRCKHKHIDHDPNSRVCRKPKCSCRCFESPWVCNCDHPWADHDHKLVAKQVPDLAAMVGDANGALEHGIAPEINNYAAMKRGQGFNDSAP
jgi:hypothetical protein